MLSPWAASRILSFPAGRGMLAKDRVRMQVCGRAGLKPKFSGFF